MKRFLMLVFVLFVLAGCVNESVVNIEQSQQRSGTMAIVRNQPVNDFNGFSVERYILQKVIDKRNENINTYSYLVTMDGKIIELCEYGSYGYGIPYSAQLTNPMKIEYAHNGVVAIPNSEPNSLYPPADSAATIVNCFNEDGSFSPQMVEDNVMTLTKRIHADIVLRGDEEDSENNVKISLDDLEAAKNAADTGAVVINK